MEKKRRIRKMTLGNLALFLAAGLLLMGSSIGSARAALTYFSNTYTSQLEMKNIGVTLLENDAYISWRDYDKENATGLWNTNENGTKDFLLFQNMLPKDDDGNVTENFRPGKTYDEKLAVRNSGTIEEYVRVNIYRYWVSVDENGVETKLQDRNPELIDLHLVNTGRWQLDQEASTRERTVLYYDSILPVDEITVPFTDTLTVKGAAVAHVEQELIEEDENKYTVIRTTYSYGEENVQFRVEVEVNAIQTHSAEEAIKSSWGRDVSISADHKLSLK